MAFELRLNSKEAAKETALTEAEMSWNYLRNRKVRVPGGWGTEGGRPATMRWDRRAKQSWLTL